jgi:hypothetical protein
MPCCGGKRAQWYPVDVAPRSKNRTASQQQPEGNTSVYFKYTGSTDMTVIGRETRTSYRFDKPGAIVAVDARDKAAFMTLPHLRLMETPPIS